MNVDATHPVRVVLFWDSEYTKYAFGPYFTRAAKKTWTFTQILTHDQLVRKIFNHQGMDPNQWHVRMTMRPDISKKGIHVLVEFEPIQLQIFLDIQHTHVSTHEDHSNVHQHVTEITQMISDKLSMLYPEVEEDNEGCDDADVDYDVSSASDKDNGDNDEEDDISTPLNPLCSTAVNQW
ncbi:hypothetical protein M9H77_17921 [Catharanthus roseus]|uniref:Uncharacterized protein n=1 Tax=Catharanthus roseus TaxID=4058 RepID=A0ACC0B614_CATRO|nr:hypothetical protein M9H77_17921 [Catharanthus roseus]